MFFLQNADKQQREAIAKQRNAVREAEFKRVDALEMEKERKEQEARIAAMNAEIKQRQEAEVREQTLTLRS